MTASFHEFGLFRAQEEAASVCWQLALVALHRQPHGTSPPLSSSWSSRWSCLSCGAGVCQCGWYGGCVVRTSFSQQLRHEGSLNSLRQEVGLFGNDTSRLWREERSWHGRHACRRQATRGSFAFGAGSDWEHWLLPAGPHGSAQRG